MGLLDIIKKPINAWNDRLNSNIGGLLGEDPEKMDPNELRRLRRMAMAQIFGEIGRGGVATDGFNRFAQGAVSERDAREAKRKEAEKQAAAENNLLGLRQSAFNLPGLPEQVRAALPYMGQGELEKVVAGFAKPQDDKYEYFNVDGIGLVAVNKSDPNDRFVVQKAGPKASTRDTYTTLSPQQVAQYGLPEGTVAQMSSDGRLSTVSTPPDSVQTRSTNAPRFVKSAESVIDNLQRQLERFEGGGPAGIRGALSRITDYQDVKQFDTYNFQLLSAVKKVFRVPGEGAQSDRDALQIIGTLPSHRFGTDKNIEIMRSIENMMRIESGLPTIEEERPDGIDPVDWMRMMPSERAAILRIRRSKR
ncbi:MAG: hypothetical protein ACO3C4_01820 [Candidatus Limnocylindrus sp.]